MTNLKILVAGGCCGIGNQEINKLNIIALDVSSNDNITTVLHMTNLKILKTDDSFNNRANVKTLIEMVY